MKAYGPGLEKTGCIINQPAEFNVKVKDAGKGPLAIAAQVQTHTRAPSLPLTHTLTHTNERTQTDHLSVLLSVLQDAEGVPVAVKVKSKGDGLYSCSYTPATALKHTLAVTWGNTSIPNSPFRVSSQSQPPIAAEHAHAVQSNIDVKERAKAFQSDLGILAKESKTNQSTGSVSQVKRKRALIIITTSTEDRWI